MLVYFSRIGGETTADEHPNGNVADIVGFMLVTPTLNDFCTKQQFYMNEHRDICDMHTLILVCQMLDKNKQ
jgi:hypothetical protein